MCRAKSDLEVRLRLHAVVRRSAKLTANSSRLADMASELDILRKVNGKAGLSSAAAPKPTRKRQTAATIAMRDFIHLN